MIRRCSGCRFALFCSFHDSDLLFVTFADVRNAVT
jgi:hypothetical protein